MREIARRLVGGAWHTGVVDESNVNGGSPPQNWAEYNGSVVTISNTGSASLTLTSKGDGENLLDITTPNTPLIVTAGVYAITAIVRVTTLTEGGWYSAVLHLDRADKDAISRFTSPTVSAELADAAQPISVSPSCTFKMPAGAQVVVVATSFDGAVDRDFIWEECIVQRIS